MVVSSLFDGEPLKSQCRSHGEPTGSSKLAKVGQKESNTAKREDFCPLPLDQVSVDLPHDDHCQPTHRGFVGSCSSGSEAAPRLHFPAGPGAAGGGGSRRSHASSIVHTWRELSLPAPFCSVPRPTGSDFSIALPEHLS